MTEPTQHRTDRTNRNQRAWTTAGAGVAALAGAAAFNLWRSGAAEAAAPPRGDFVEVDGVRVHHIVEGSGSPVVLLHGNGVTLQDWELSGVLAAAAERFRTVAFDRPGFGYTARPRATAWTPAAQADLLIRACKKLGIARPIVVGHSWGTLAALAMALDHPDDVAGLVLVSGYYFGTVRPDAALVSPVALPVLGDILAHTVSPLTGRLLYPGAVKATFSPAPVDERFHAMRGLMMRPSQVRADAADGALMVPAALALSRRYGDLKAPTHILAGECDRIVDIDGHAAKLADAASGATLRRFKDLGHMLHYARPEAVVESIEAVARAA